MTGTVLGRWGGCAAVAALLLSGAGGSAAAQDGADLTVKERIQKLEADLQALKDAKGGSGADAAETQGEEGGLAVELPGATHLKITGQLRLRGQVRSERSYATSTANYDVGTAFVEQRVRLGFDFEIGEHLRVMIEAQDSRVWGDTALGKDVTGDKLFLRQGFLEVKDMFGVPLDLRAGRYAVSNLGDQRLISSLDWSNVTRFWDGAQLTFHPEGWWFTVFGQNLREAAALSTTDASENDDFWIYGAYASCRLIPKFEIDGFFYWRNLDDPITKFKSEPDPANGGAQRTGTRKDFTLGGRVKGEVGPFGFNGMLAYQFGDQAGDAIRAWAAAIKPWVAIPLGGDMKVKMGVEYSFASGDQNPTDGTQRTFDPILPFGHYYNGHQDLFGWRNLHQISMDLGVTLMKGLSLNSNTHLFWLAQKSDAWYAVNGAVLRSGSVGSSFAGTELDLFLKYKAGKNLFIWTGYSHFFPGAVVRDTGSARPQDWAFFQAQITF